MACASDCDINIFKMNESSTPVKKLTGHTSFVWDLLLHKDGQRILSTSYDNSMRVWSIKSGSCIKTFQESSCNFKMVWFSEVVVATAYGNGGIKFWNVESGEYVRTVNCKGKQLPVFGLVVDQEGVLVSWGEGNKVTYWSN